MLSVVFFWHLSIRCSFAASEWKITKRRHTEKNLVSGDLGTYCNEEYKTYLWIPGAIGHFAKVDHPNHPKRLQKNQSQKHGLRQNRSTTSLGPMQNLLETFSKTSQMFLQIVSPAWLSLGACVFPDAFQQRCFFPAP